ncbi:MAG: hypothetical protein ACK5U7_09435 [Bacteroidota bacterium]|jgi:hypothetical protein
MKTRLQKLSYRGIIGTVVDGDNMITATAKDYSINKQIFKKESNSVDVIFEMVDTIINENKN